VHKNMELYEIENRRECFEKVLTMANFWISKLRENNGD